MRDFPLATRRALARKGITILRPTALPNMASAMPFANADRGYVVNDNGTSRVMTFVQVLEAAR
jgi:hypothetical protein